jgi:hypothetical protein
MGENGPDVGMKTSNTRHSAWGAGKGATTASMNGLDNQFGLEAFFNDFDYYFVHGFWSFLHDTGVRSWQGHRLDSIHLSDDYKTA